MADAGIVVFDKTGTLTKGNFVVSQVFPEQLSREELLELAALAEGYSDHPISRSLKAAYGREIESEPSGAGGGSSGPACRPWWMGKTVLAGNEKLLAKHGVACPPCDCVGTVIHVAADGVYARPCGYLR